MFIIAYTQAMHTGRQDYALKLYFIPCFCISKDVLPFMWVVN